AGGTDRNVGNFADRSALLKWAGAEQPKPRVSLAHIVAAAKRDPGAAQGHVTYKAEVLVVERALKAEGLLAGQYVDGSFGSLTVNAYARWQKRLDYSGSAADGIPGMTSLKKLGARHGFSVVA
ncbi:peptidoglycan-binding protein, partial [Streptomyces sp. NK08204]|uniref:peptidoglycan-binding domain-containing protein n=1 Tax=Streptomyces sp. NK08204 TaxID=2873260 RepID=UPI0035A93344